MPRPAPTLTVSLPTFGPAPGPAPSGPSGPTGWRRLLDLAIAAEAAGVDRVVVSDHVVLGPHVDRYPWGRFPTAPEADWLEPLTVLTALAAVTDRVRLATGILVAPLRPAAVLAKTVATLDVLSGGRVDLGVGTGWQPEEFEAVGADFASRGRLLTDTIAACRALWTGAPVTFRSSTITFADIACAPTPAQERLPVWFSGTLTPRNLRRIVELGDGWIPIMGSTAAEIRDGVDTLHAALADAGRDPGHLRVQAPASLVRDGSNRFDLAASMASIPPLVDAGATDLQVNLRVFSPTLDDAPAVLGEMVARFREAVPAATA